MVRRPALDPHREEVVYILMRQVPLKLMFKIVISTILLERYPSLWVSYCGPQARTSVSHFWSAWIGFIVFKKHVEIQITEN
jgi:hypothetical protein